MEQQKECGECQEVEDGADKSEDDHVAPDLLNIPALWVRHARGVDPVCRDRHRRHVGEEVVEQDLLRDHWQERQQRRRERHAVSTRWGKVAWTEVLR